MDIGARQSHQAMACKLSRAGKWLNRAILDTSHNVDCTKPLRGREAGERFLVVNQWGQKGRPVTSETAT